MGIPEDTQVIHIKNGKLEKKYWNQRRKEQLEQHSFCEKCGSTDRLEVDHKISIMLGGERFSNANFQTLCYSCHKKKTKEDIKKIAEARHNGEILRVNDYYAVGDYFILITKRFMNKNGIF